MLRIVLNSRWLIWGLLALPALAMVNGYASAQADAGDLLHPSGETSARLMIVAMMIGPLVDLLGPRSWLLWMMQRRRWFGVAAFVYALVHLVFYLIDMGNFPDMLAELGAPGIWTGWLAFLVMLAAATTSNDAAVRALRRNWTRVQQTVYGVALLTLAHWYFLAPEIGPALVHFVPLILLYLLRLAKLRRKFA